MVRIVETERAMQIWMPYSESVFQLQEHLLQDEQAQAKYSSPICIRLYLIHCSNVNSLACDIEQTG